MVSQLDILLPGKKPFVTPSAVIHSRKKLGYEPVEAVFNQTQQLWHEKTPHPDWYGLTLHAVDGMVWRTPDTADNDKAFSRTGNQTTTSDYPEVLRYILDMAESFVLPERRERTYPRAVKKRPSCYATRHSRERNSA
jgi:hypothetical protein